MAKLFDAIDEPLREWIARQSLFFEATAPLRADGHVNLSPKGPIGTLCVLGRHEIAYLDLIGSRAETIAHLRENGRITIMFCAFEGAPKILRLYGRGTVIAPANPDFASLRGCFGDFDGVRSVIRVALTRIADSCGYGVPQYRYEGDRTQLGDWARRKGPEAVQRYQDEHNGVSLDGLPGLRRDGG